MDECTLGRRQYGGALNSDTPAKCLLDTVELLYSTGSIDNHVVRKATSMYPAPPNSSRPSVHGSCSACCSLCGIPGKHRCAGSSKHFPLPKSAYPSPTLGWPKDHPVQSDMFYSACTKLPNGTQRHPLDKAGLEAAIIIEHSRREIVDNTYIENLRKLIDERTAALRKNLFLSHGVAQDEVGQEDGRLICAAR